MPGSREGVFDSMILDYSGNKLGGDLGEILTLGAEILPIWDPERSGSLPKKKYFF